MNPKNALTAGLLMFVAASIVVLTVKSLRQQPDPSSTAATTSSAAGEQDSMTPVSDGVIVYYFHGNVRCPTCKQIEADAHESLQQGFAREMKDGRLVWRIVNYEQPGNEHFATEFQLIAPTVVLTRMDGGKQTQWKNLDRVWELVGEKPAFGQYVQEETRAILDANPTQVPVAAGTADGPRRG